MCLPVTSDPLVVLLEHNRWATHQVLDLCRRISRDQFHQRFEIGLGSLHDTLVHSLSCLRAWTDHAADRDERPTMDADGARYTVDDLARVLDEATDGLRRVIERTRSDLAAHVHVTLGGMPCTFTRGVAITHALVHGTHHRAQCLNMLRHLTVAGVSDRLPDLDVNDWQYETECKS